MRPRIGIVTFRSDMHAVAVVNAINRLDATIDVHVFEVDALSSYTGAIFLGLEDNSACFLHDSFNRRVQLSSLTLVWWRRSTFPQRNNVEDLMDDDVDVINRDSQTFIEALFTLNFSGGWVNCPRQAKKAESKPLQMLAALKEGLHVPQTIITNDPNEVRKLIGTEKVYVVKSLAGLPGMSLLTQELTPELVENEISILLSPACYQRYINGHRHIRLLAFGSECVGVITSSSQIDSRVDFSSAPQPFNVSDELKYRLQGVLRRLHLAMGVFDLKLTDEDVPFFLEVNQQGQFLYLDAMAEMGLTEKFAAFLIREAQNPNFSLRGEPTGRLAVV